MISLHCLYFILGQCFPNYFSCRPLLALKITIYPQVQRISEYTSEAYVTMHCMI
jgi:hypothetical protein